MPPERVGELNVDRLRELFTELDRDLAQSVEAAVAGLTAQDRP